MRPAYRKSVGIVLIKQPAGLHRSPRRRHRTVERVPLADAASGVDPGEDTWARRSANSMRKPASVLRETPAKVAEWLIYDFHAGAGRRKALSRQRQKWYAVRFGDELMSRALAVSKAGSELAWER